MFTFLCRKLISDVDCFLLMFTFFLKQLFVNILCGVCLSPGTHNYSLLCWHNYRWGNHLGDYTIWYTTFVLINNIFHLFIFAITACSVFWCVMGWFPDMFLLTACYVLAAYIYVWIFLESTCWNDWMFVTFACVLLLALLLFISFCCCSFSAAGL